MDPSPSTSMATSSKPSSPTPPPPRSPSLTSHSDDNEDDIREEPLTDVAIQVCLSYIHIPRAALTWIVAQTCLRDAEALKTEGNDHFRALRWNKALVSYRSALGRLPRRKFVERKTEEGARGRKKWDIKGKGRGDGDGDEDEAKEKESVDIAVSSSSVQAEPGEASGAAEEKEDKTEEKEEPVKLSPLETECAKARSVLNANIGACHVKLVRLVHSLYLFRQISCPCHDMLILDIIIIIFRKRIPQQ